MPTDFALLHAGNAGCQFRRNQPVIGCLIPREILETPTGLGSIRLRAGSASFSAT
jgi:hypothetical protein